MRASFAFLKQRSPDRRRSSRNETGTKATAGPERLLRPSYPAASPRATPCGNSQCSAGIIMRDVWLVEKASVEAQDIRMDNATTGNHGFRGCVIGRMADSTIQPDSLEPHAL